MQLTWEQRSYYFLETRLPKQQPAPVSVSKLRPDHNTRYVRFIRYLWRMSASLSIVRFSVLPNVGKHLGINSLVLVLVRLELATGIVCQSLLSESDRHFLAS